MKRIVAIILLLTFLFTQTELKQLNKLPFMVQHFLKHNQNGMTLGQFISHHYFSGDKKYADNEQDMKLPFKSFDSSHSNTLTIALSAKNNFSFQPLITLEKNKFSLYSERIPSPRPADIWQPPKIS